MEFLETFFESVSTPVTLIFFIIGLILIIKGGDSFVDSASWIAEVLGVPKFIIGATIVSIATTLPETIVGITATAKGNVDMTAGNAIGSITVNTSFVMALFILFMPFAVKRKEFSPKAIILLLASAALVGGCLITEKAEMTFSGETNIYYTLSVIGVVALVVLFVVFFVENFITTKKSDVQIEPDPHGIGLQYEDGIIPSKETATSKDWFKNIAMFVIGAAFIVIGAELLVNAGTVLAEDIGVPQRVISVIAIAIGTSLPELVTTISALRKKESGISVGNIFGANILNLTLVIPCATFASLGKTGQLLAVSTSSIHIDMMFCIAILLIAIVPTLIAQKFRRWQGAVMMAGYVGYVIYTVFG